MHSSDVGCPKCCHRVCEKSVNPWVPQPVDHTITLNVPPEYKYWATRLAVSWNERLDSRPRVPDEPINRYEVVADPFLEIVDNKDKRRLGAVFHILQSMKSDNLLDYKKLSAAIHAVHL